MIVRILRSLRMQGITDCVLNLHHLPQTIAAVVGDGADLGVHVRYSWEQPRVLGSAGGPRHALRDAAGLAALSQRPRLGARGVRAHRFA